MSFTADSLTLPILELAKASSPLILRFLNNADNDHNDDDNDDNNDDNDEGNFEINDDNDAQDEGNDDIDNDEENRNGGSPEAGEDSPAKSTSFLCSKTFLQKHKIALVH